MLRELFLDLRKLLKVFWAPFLSGALLISCATYYEVNNEFNRNFELGNPEAADQVLADDKKASKGKDKLLYYLNRGVVNSMIGNYELSNEFFEKAYLFSEDFRKNYLREAASFLTNPNVIAYSGEIHEILLLHYYKAINYLKLEDPDAALVECRRMDIKLRQLGDRFRSDKKYQRDAFINTLMGIIYDSDRDYNNAFIAYRNAYQIYKEDYARLFNLNPPEQLKQDLLRTAYLTGFYDEVEFYENEFGIRYEHNPDQLGDILFFWNNGLGPVKAEWSINFVIVKDAFGVVHFQNDEYGFDFPFPLDNYEDEDGTDLVEDLRVVRVAFPKYVERQVMFNQAYLETDGKQYPLYLTENINAIAFKSLEQRMLKEFSTALIRLGLKKLAEKKARDEGEGWGALVGLINAATEKADTRNWQTLPHSIYYTRLSLPQGRHEVNFKTISGIEEGFNQNHLFAFTITPGKTIFHSFHSLELSPYFDRRGYY